MNRSATTLADGRELIYFDDADGASRDALDTRALRPHAPFTELRYDVLVDEWVAIATQRQDRTHLPSSNDCPLCPSTPGRPTEIPASDYDVVVFENRFPAFDSRVRDGSTAATIERGPVIRRPGAGRCEIVCFTSEHDASFAELPVTRVRTVLEAWIDRTLALSRLPGVEQVFPFENRGAAIGVTLSHPHGQIYAYPFVTPRASRMLASAQAHREKTGRDLFADVVAAEERDGERIVTCTDHWIAFVPAAARWPIEIHAYPRDPVRDLPGLSAEAREDFCVFYLDLLRRLDRLYAVETPYVAAWHQAPVHAADGIGCLHLELHSIQRSETKLKYLAGSEAAMGAFINDVAPEHAAALLRAQPRSDRFRTRRTDGSPVNG